jgi:cobyrinic acid a,c-diamide synthase
VELASTAHVAKLLAAPVVLVVDARAMARSVAAMVHGYSTFDPELRVAGVVLNRVGSAAHERMLREALEPLGIPVLGVLRRGDAIRTPDRHLGLVPAVERRKEARRTLDALGAVVARSLDLDGILRLARSAGPLDAEPWSPEVPEEDRTEGVRVAVASGPSFSFLYRENLELLEGAGAEVVTFDPTSDEDLPEGVGTLYLGGGFPETYAGALSANEPLRERVRAFAGEGRPVVCRVRRFALPGPRAGRQAHVRRGRRLGPHDGPPDARLPRGTGSARFAARRGRTPVSAATSSTTRS